MNFSLFSYAEMLACLASIIYARKLAKTAYWILTPYMIMIVAAETTGKYLADRKLYVQNLHLFNITTVIEYVIFYSLFYKNLQHSGLKKIVLYTIPIYVLLAATNQLFIQGFDNLHTYTMVIGTIFLIIFVFFYFYEALSTVEPINLLQEPMFWFSIGVFIFNLGDMTYNLLLPYLLIHHMGKEGKHLFRIINNNLIIFEYVCITIAIVICGNNNRLALKPRS